MNLVNVGLEFGTLIHVPSRPIPAQALESPQSLH